jgi:hypothetical protein
MNDSQFSGESASRNQVPIFAVIARTKRYSEKRVWRCQRGKTY